jgi:hypothetical protein
MRTRGGSSGSAVTTSTTASDPPISRKRFTALLAHAPLARVDVGDFYPHFVPVGMWRSFAYICGNSIRQLHALAPKLPIELSEVASAEAGGSKATCNGVLAPRYK